MEDLKEFRRPQARRAKSRSRRIALIYDARSAYDTKMTGIAKYIHDDDYRNLISYSCVRCRFI